MADYKPGNCEFSFQTGGLGYRSLTVETPLIQVLLLLLVTYVFYLWLGDWRASRNGEARPGALPGAHSCPKPIIFWGIAGAIGLVAIETAGESLLGVSSEQSSMTVLFFLVTLASAFGEELVFRGYLVVPNKGKAVLWSGIIGFSILFALVHPYLWSWEDGRLVMQMNSKAWFSTWIVFLNSLWFYYLRFSRANPTHSLWPCILAHAASNGAVFFVKLVQGHIHGLY